MLRNPILAIFLTTLLSACERETGDSNLTSRSTTWSDEQEVVHQLKEVIRYEDAEASLRQEQMRALSLPVERPATSKP